MANTRLSDLASGSAITATDLFYSVQTAGVGGVQITGAQLKEFIEDTIASLILGGSNISVAYSDATPSLTISYTGAPPPTDTDDLPEGSTNLYFTDARAITAVEPLIREKLTANRTYFVATTGSDSNDGLTVGAPFLTIQKAVDVAAALDASIYNVTIQCADGTYSMNRIILKPPVGSGTYTLLGNTTTPANCVLNNTANGSLGSTGFISTTGASGNSWIVDGFTLQRNAGSGSATTLSAFYAASSALNVRRVIIDGSTGAAWSIGMLADTDGTITCSHDLSLSGSYSTFWQAQSQGKVVFNGSPSPVCTLTSTPVFSTAFARTSIGAAFVGRGTFSGSATGPRYAFSSGGIFSVTGSSPTYFPGSSAGTGVNGTDGFYGF